MVMFAVNKRFKVTYSPEVQEVMSPIGKRCAFNDPMNMSLCLDDGIMSAINRMMVTATERVDDEIMNHLMKVALEKGFREVFVLDKHIITQKLKRLNSVPVTVKYLRPEGSDHYYCPTCNAMIGKYPFCKHCGQALDWSDV